MLYLILPIITLILEILPYGAVCNFGNPDGPPFRETYSYFNLLPYGYANFGPFLTAIISSVIFALMLVYLFTDKYRIISIVKVLLCIGIVFSLCPLIYGINYFSFVGALITLSLIGELVVILATDKSRIN